MAANKGKKCSWKDNISFTDSDEGDGVTVYNTVFKQLEGFTHCEAYCGYYFISCTRDHDNHYHLSYIEMSLWAKKIVSLQS